MPTIEDFDDDTDFDLPAPPTAAASGAGGAGPPIHPNMPGMPSLSADQMQAFQQMMMSQGGGGGGDPSTASARGAPPPAPPSAEAKEWITLYPIYFDAKRSHKTGQRRVGWSHSSLYPHALGIAKALHNLGLKVIQEPTKTHPRDWENPGRVKVRVFDTEGNPVAKTNTGEKVVNRRQLLQAVAPVLQKFCGGPPPMDLPKREKKQRGVKHKATNEVVSESKSAAATTSQKGTKDTSKVSSAAAPLSKGKTTTTTTTFSSSSKSVTGAGTTGSTTGKSSPPRLPNAGSSSRLAKLNRNHLLRPHLPPAHIRLPSHSPALSANLLNMDLQQGMGSNANDTTGAIENGGGGGIGAGAGNPLSALGSMMGNLGFGQEDQEEEGDGKEAGAGAEGKKAPNDPFKGMGRRGRKRVVRVGR